jgi:hypothetical protein
MLTVLPSVAMKPRTVLLPFQRCISSSSDAPFLREIRLSRISFLLPAIVSGFMLLVVLPLAFFEGVGSAAAAGSGERFSASVIISSGSAVAELAGARDGSWREGDRRRAGEKANQGRRMPG